jgi:hypothetical protein
VNPYTQEIRNLVESINQAWKQGLTTQLREFFHPDIVIVGPGFQEIVRGQAACIESYREFSTNAKVHDYIESDFKIEVWDDTAVCTYAWTMTYERAGERSRETGTDQFVFSRQHGKWLVVWRYIYFEPAKTA